MLKNPEKNVVCTSYVLFSRKVVSWKKKLSYVKRQNPVLKKTIHETFLYLLLHMTQKNWLFANLGRVHIDCKYVRTEFCFKFSLIYFWVTFLVKCFKNKTMEDGHGDKLFLIVARHYCEPKIVLRHTPKMHRWFYKVDQSSNRYFRFSIA
jgi:hypothetical protein